MKSQKDKSNQSVGIETGHDHQVAQPVAQGVETRATDGLISSKG
jgi:hypothetical protein